MKNIAEPRNVQKCLYSAQFVALSGGEAGDNRQQEGSIIGPSRFWVQNGQVPEANADTVALLPYYHYLPHRFASQRWTPQACKELQAQVLISVKVSLDSNELSCLYMRGTMSQTSP